MFTIGFDANFSCHFGTAGLKGLAGPVASDSRAALEALGFIGTRGRGPGSFGVP